MNHIEHNNRKYTDGQVITTAVVSALYLRGNHTMSLDYMDSHIFEHMLKKSGFTKRLHKLKEVLMFILLRIGSASFSGTKNRGYNASKRERFYGVKIQLVTTADRIPVEMYLVQGAEHDSKTLKRMYHDLPPESSLFGDSGYTKYEIEDMFRKIEQVHLVIGGNSKSKRKDIPPVAFIKRHMRKRIETSISQICALMPRHINALTADGFIIKLILFVMAF